MGLFLWSEQVPDGVSCSASSRTSSCTAHVMAHARGVQCLFGASTAELQIHIALLNTHSEGRPDRISILQAPHARPSNCLKSCLLACASLRTPLNQFHILRHVLRCLRLNIVFLCHIEFTANTVVDGGMALTGVVFPSIQATGAHWKLAGSCSFQTLYTRGIFLRSSAKTTSRSYHNLRHRFHA